MHRRRIRLRQEHHRAGPDGPAAAGRDHHLGQRPVRGARPVPADRPAARRFARQPHGDDLPGADDQPEPGLHHRRPDRRGHPPAQGGRQGRGPRPGAGDAAPGAHPGAGEAAGRLSAPAVGRHAPARHDRHGPGQRPAAADRRRADHGAGRHHPGPDPGAGAAAAGRDRHRHDPDHPRPRRGGGGRRPCRGDVCRTHRRIRPGRGHLRGSAAPLHHRADGIGAVAGPARGAPGHHPRHGAAGRPHAAGLPLRPALPLRRAALHRRDAAGEAGRAGPPRRLLVRAAGTACRPQDQGSAA